MATATTLSAWDNALKQYYRGKEVEKVVYDSHPFMELVPKTLGLQSEMVIEKSFELLERQELSISSQALKKEGSTIIPKGSTL